MTLQPYFEDETIQIFCGDCREVLAQIEAQSVDAVITDPPYGTTNCPWDDVIPFQAMWGSLQRISKPHTPIVLFGSQPFTGALVMSNPRMFRHERIWKKTIATNFYVLDQHPAKKHENICVFAEGKFTYNPQMEQGEAYIDRRNRNDKKVGIHNTTSAGRRPIFNEGTRHPSSVQTFSNGNNETEHSTQKPLALMEYLILTYSNPGDLILDFTMGSGTTLRAAKNLGRRAIGIEIDERYCEIAAKRIAQEVMVF